MMTGMATLVREGDVHLVRLSELSLWHILKYPA
jgi:hypothetical protein